MQQDIQENVQENPREKDVVIIGAGPAGLSLALGLTEAKIDYLLLERSSLAGGQLFEINNALFDLAAGPYENGPALAKAMNELTKLHSINVLFDHSVKEVNCKKLTLNCISDSREISFRAKNIVLATGYRMRRLELFDSSAYLNNIAYRIHEMELSSEAGRKVAVIGAGDNAFIAALKLVSQDYGAQKVYLISRSKAFKARPDLVAEAIAHKNIEVITAACVQSLRGSKGHLEAVDLKIDSKDGCDSRVLEVNNVLVKVGYEANTELLKDQVAMSDSSHIVVNKQYQTSSKNVFAIGDIVAGSFPRIAVALGHGAQLVAHLREQLESLPNNDC